MSDLRQDLQALIGAEEEWPEGVRQVVLCYGVEPGESCPDSCSHRPVENCACDVLPSDNVIPALLAVAGMVKRGTCGECETMPVCMIRKAYLDSDGYGLKESFGCIEFERRQPVYDTEVTKG